MQAALLQGLGTQLVVLQLALRPCLPLLPLQQCLALQQQLLAVLVQLQTLNVATRSA
jgi:hypothetical protein